MNLSGTRRAVALVAVLCLPMAASLASEDRLLLPGGTLLVSDAERFRLYDATRAPARLGSVMTVDRLAPGYDLKRTQQLLSGTFTAAWLGQKPAIESSQRKGEVTLPRYIYSLAGSYETTRATPVVMRRLAAKLRAAGHASSAKFCEAVATNESGHEDELIRDLTALGIDAKAFVEGVRLPGARALVAHFNRLVDGDEPLAAIGYVYALQRSSLLLDREITERIEAVIPPGINASRSLRTHGGTGDNARHVAETERMVSTLPPAARRAVALALFDTLRLMLEEDDYPGDAVAERAIGGFRMARR